MHIAPRGLESSSHFLFLMSSFWSLTVSKNGRGRLGPFYHMNDANVYLGRQREGERGPRPSWKPFLVASVKVLKFQTFMKLHGNFQLVRDEEHMHEMYRWPFRPSVYLGRYHPYDFPLSRFWLFTVCKNGGARPCQWELGYPFVLSNDTLKLVQTLFKTLCTNLVDT